MNSSTVRYRGRMAPSPTGRLHLGHAATFATAADRANAAGSTLILRIDDLDPQRCRPEFTQGIIEDLQWLGLDWQEGPEVGGPLGPYLQSERTYLYAEALQKLAGAGNIYRCRCSRKDLVNAPQAPHEQELIYPGICRPGPDAISTAFETVATQSENWRFRISPGEKIEFVDGFYGPQCFTAGVDFGDFLVWRKDGIPAYQLAVAVDDAAMQISEVVRGADLLLSTARQILLCRALDLGEPGWRHCPLLRDAAGERLSKRNDALSLNELRASGMKRQDVMKMVSDYRGMPVSHRGPDL